MNRFSRFIQKLSPGDTAIAAFLVFLFVLGAIVTGAVVLRSFQVAIPAYGGTLREGVVGSPRFVNPLLAISDSDRDLVTLTYAGLMGHQADGTLEPILASSYTISQDGTIYTFTLRPGVTFSDGTPVTADDAVFTIQKAQDPSLKSPEYANWANIRVEAIDSKTVRFTLPKAYAPFLEEATLGILPKHIWQKVSSEEFPFTPYVTMPVGAGPFKTTSVKRDSEGVITEYSLTSFENYALGKPYLSKVYLSFFDTSEALQKAYANGSISSTYGLVEKTTRSVPYARVFAVFFNSAVNPALKDVRVRKALSLAVDRTSLTQGLLGGYATPLAGPIPAGSTIPPVQLPNDATRLEEAKKELGEAGYIFSEGSWKKDGEKLTVTLTTSNVPELTAVASEIQKNWQALGVAVELELHDSSSLTQTVIRPRAYGALLFGEVIGTSPDLFAFWSGGARTDPGLNIANYQNTDVDTLLVKARTESDPVLRATTLSTIQEKIAVDYPAAFLYTPSFLYTVPLNIYGVSLTQVRTPSDRFWGIARWYRYREYVWPAFVPHSKTGENAS